MNVTKSLVARLAAEEEFIPTHSQGTLTVNQLITVSVVTTLEVTGASLKLIEGVVRQTDDRGSSSSDVQLD